MHFHWGAFLNPFVSLFDEEARRITRDLAGSVPEGSWFRTERFRRFFDVARGAAEKGFHFDNKVLETFKEKLVDYGDYFTTALGGAPAGEPSRAKVVKAAKDWMDKFSAEVQARLAKTPPEKFEEESQKILLEFELRRGFYEALDEAMRKAGGETAKPEPEEEVWIDWDGIQNQFRGLLKGASRVAARAVNQTEKTAKERIPRLNSQLDDSILDFLSKKRWWLRPSRKRRRQIQADLAARDARFKVGGTANDEDDSSADITIRR